MFHIKPKVDLPIYAYSRDISLGSNATLSSGTKKSFGGNGKMFSVFGIAIDEKVVIFGFNLTDSYYCPPIILVIIEFKCETGILFNYCYHK
jgi:hypothetical protein